jgi:hypothetical protein
MPIILMCAASDTVAAWSHDAEMHIYVHMPALLACSALPHRCSDAEARCGALHACFDATIRQSYACSSTS